MLEKPWIAERAVRPTKILSRNSKANELNGERTLHHDSTGNCVVFSSICCGIDSGTQRRINSTMTAAAKAKNIHSME